MHPDSCRPSNPSARPVSIVLAAFVSIGAATGLSIGVPIWRKHVAFREVERAGGNVKTEYGRKGTARLLDNLTEVDLSGTDIQDAGLEFISGIQGLRVLDLGDTKVTDRALMTIARQETLEKIGLRLTGVTDAGMEDLRKLPHLKTLDLDGTAVTDAGLVHLRDHTSLTKISLNTTRTTDAGLLQIGSILGLVRIGLSGTPVTDAGLKHLNGLKQLREVSLAGTQVTADGVLDLEEAIPGLRVIW